MVSLYPLSVCVIGHHFHSYQVLDLFECLTASQSDYWQSIPWLIHDSYLTHVCHSCNMRMYINIQCLPTVVNRYGNSVGLAKQVLSE